MKRLLSNYSFLIPLITLSSGCFADQPANINFNGSILTTATPVKWELVTASMHFDTLNEKDVTKQTNGSYVFNDVKGKTDLNQTTSDSTYLAAAVQVQHLMSQHQLILNLQLHLNRVQNH
ncbi:hypothetical protein [Photobacterium leiognathi]|uniref:hypothetical protein n=1 Tax=Photobacterium leiognathi TaxID=553611 RepID=UPI0027373B74|nr:hypothetical protein [Photobacterium leiognathi]